MRGTVLVIFLLSASTLMFEIILTRIFSVAQFYHFAFMIVSMALLGTGASGTVLSLVSRENNPFRLIPSYWFTLLTSISILVSFIFTNIYPFDSYQITYDWRQVLILIFYYVLLSAPFFFCGLVVGSRLAGQPKTVGRIYGFNLTGSATGCIIALLIPSFVGGEGAVVLSSGVSAIATVWAMVEEWEVQSVSRTTKRFCFMKMVGVIILACEMVFISTDIYYRLNMKPSYSFLNLSLSTYKGLSYALNNPDAELIKQRWNSFSRIDLVRSASFHSLPGLSYRFLDLLPIQKGLFVDGDNLNPVMSIVEPLSFTQYLPSAVAYKLKPTGNALILEPAGGLEIVVAIASGLQHITVVVSNPLIINVAGDIYQDKRVEVFQEAERNYLHKNGKSFDLLVFALTSTYHPVKSGAYSLIEDYRFTMESFRDALARLQPDGILVVTRWIQNPPSECLRTFILGVSALESIGGDPLRQVVVFRGYNTSTMLIKKSPYTTGELRVIRELLVERAYDFTYAPGITPEETNQYNIVPGNVYYSVFSDFLKDESRDSFIRRYTYDVTPPIDNHPFFNHFFKWSQAGQVIAEFGKTWQPFGGAGYFVILALLVLSTGLAMVFILLPYFPIRLNLFRQLIRSGNTRNKLFKYLTYFILIGLSYLFIEIPLIQRFILYLGQPAYSMTIILFTLLLFSGMGSLYSEKVSVEKVLLMLGILTCCVPLVLFPFSHWTMGWAFGWRLFITILALAPLGFCMGVPFPGGIRWVNDRYTKLAESSERSLPHQSIIPWVWGVNGVSSVVAATLAALLALNYGFSWVVISGAMCYFVAFLVIRHKR